MTVFGYQDYKIFLKEQIRANKHVYGYKSQLARAAGCHNSFLSQVLNTSVQITPEHAVGLLRFWGLNESEGDYFVLLVQWARAGTPSLRRYIENKLVRLKSESQNLAKRFEQPGLETTAESSIYYSNWLYAAVHVLISIARFQTPQAICEKLLVPIERVRATLQILEQLGLAKEVKGRWNSTRKSIHLPKSSFMNSVNHSNWRQLASSYSAHSASDRATHYTGIYSMSRRDFDRLRQMTLELIDRSREVVSASPEEELVCQITDVFLI